MANPQNTIREPGKMINEPEPIKEEDRSRRYNNEIFFKAFQLNPSLMAISSFTENKYIDVNNSFLEKLGYTRDEIIGKTSKELQIFADLVQSDKFLKKLKSFGKVLDFEISYRTKQGKIRKGLFSAEPIEMDGELCLLSIIHDITELRRTRETLEQTEFRYKEILENMTNCVMVLEAVNGGLDFVVLEYNRSAEKVEHINRKRIIGKNLAVVFKMAAQTGFIDCLKRVYRTGRPEKILITFTDAKKTLQYRDNSVYKLPTGELVIIYDDVTGKKKDEEALQKSEQRFRELAEMLPLGVFEADPLGNITYANRHAFSLTGYAREDMKKGFNAFHLLSAGDARKAWSALKDRIRGKKFYSPAEYTIIRKDGTMFPAIVYINLVSHDKEPTGIRGVLVDITDRKKAQEKLEVEKAYFELLIESSPEAIAINDNDGRILQVNSEFAHLFGWEEEEILGKMIDELVAPDHLYTEASEITKKISGGQRVECESVRKCRNGRLVDVSIMGTPIIVNNRQVGVYGIYRDISERKKSEKIQSLIYQISRAVITTRDLEELSQVIKTELSKVMDTTNFFIALYNKEEDLLTLPFFRDEKDDFNEIPAGKTITAYVIRTAKSVLLREADMDELEKRGEIDLVGSGSKIWLGVPLHARNEIIGVISVQSYDREDAYTRDDLEILEFVASQVGITIQWKKAEDALYNSLQRYRAVAETTVAGIAIVDADYRISYVNAALAAMLGYEPSEIAGINLSALTDKTSFRQIREKTGIHTLIRHHQFETSLKKKDGSAVQVLVSASPQPDEEKKYLSILFVMIDISPLKEVQRELIKAKEQAEEAAEAKQRFLSTMSHEIRTPLNAIIGMSHVMLQENPRPDQVENLRALNFSADNLLVLINDILDVSKIEAGKVSLEAVDFNFRELIHGIQQTFIFKALEKNISFTVRDDPSIPDLLIGDRTRLNQILTNLLANAIKFTEEGSVQLTIKHAGNRDDSILVDFSVEDTGIGIPGDKINDIFNSFTQASTDTARKYGGTGLGLTISKQLIILHNSELKVESTVGKGSKFYFTLAFPISKLTEIHTADEFSVEGYDKLRGRKILLVEDNKMNQVVASRFLTKWGVLVDLAENGEEALRKFSENCYDMVLMDLQMPLMSGYEASRLIRARQDQQGKVPIIAVTAAMAAEIQDKIREVKMNDYILKPFNPNELYKKIIKNLKD